VEEADREADRDLVEAGREPKREQGEPAATCELAHLLAFVFLVVQEHPGPEQGEHSDRDVVGGAADYVTERVAEEKSDNGHRHLEAGHHEADAQTLARRKSAHAKRSRDREGVETKRDGEEEQLEQRSTRLTAGERMRSTAAAASAIRRGTASSASLPSPSRARVPSSTPGRRARPVRESLCSSACGRRPSRRPARASSSSTGEPINWTTTRQTRSPQTKVQIVEFLLGEAGAMAWYQTAPVCGVDGEPAETEVR
jgi:hypothetical protein